ncbi:TPA: hypothetical protein ACHU6O_001940 [Streptococcus suis]|uniref:hypothetical protein n=1 Tax=Streptococcus suis TaxID=1307 RepID=UPI001147642A|nr:hypothetical protein [Streptococcus suis]MCK4018255.1 hypothetical protein [Streptococcus suis]TQE69659.1 hypothetical protein FH696_10345 [Streptococcus suis]
MSFINQFKSQSKTVLATVAISVAILGFAGGMSISKSSAGVSIQSQVTLAQNGSVAKSGQVATQGMLPGQGGATQDISPGQGITPPDATSGATQSNSSTSSDEVNALKKRNQEIKAQISGDSSSSNQ